MIIINDYKGFIISESQYIEQYHPQYNCLGFRAENAKKQYIEVSFSDYDIRLKGRDGLLDLFLRQVDRFNNELLDLSLRDET